MELEYYKSEDGIYVARPIATWLKRRESISTSASFKINEKSVSTSQHPSWVFVEGESELKSMSQLRSGLVENYRWGLSDKAPDAIKKLTPEVLTIEEACEYHDDDLGWVFGEESDHYEYRAFYSRIFDVKPDFYEDVEIDISFLGDIKSEWVNDPVKARFSVYRNPEYPSKGETELDISSAASYSELSQMLTPDLLLSNQPCSISSEQTFEIVRKHINDNINSTWAVVTSDYDFCFTVKKKIAVKPYEHRRELLTSRRKSYRPPRFSSRTIEHRKVECFEMTPAGKPYGEYTPIKGFSGESLAILVENIETYLQELMGHINSPVSECPNCKGAGHVFGDSYKMNER